MKILTIISIFSFLQGMSTSGFNCERKIEYLETLDCNCAKLEYLEQEMDVRCLISFINEIADESGISASYDLGTGGIYYRSDSLFFNDINRWKVYYKCDQKEKSQ